MLGAGCLWLTPGILGTWEAEIRSEYDNLRPAQAKGSQDPIAKITRAKWIGGVTQTGECVLHELEALSSNPSPTKYISIFIYTCTVIFLEESFICTLWS
jgi:hypothetical protein